MAEEMQAARERFTTYGPAAQRHRSASIRGIGCVAGRVELGYTGSMVAMRKPSPGMTVAEFLDWDSGDRTGALWQLRDGEPEMMAPASDPHGMIQGELGSLIRNHLADRNSPCRVGVTPGVVPRVRSTRNLLVPDLGVTCAPPAGGPTMLDPVVLIEILSPSNARETRANVWAYTSIPSVAEIVLIRSTSIAAEVLRRQSDASWPGEPEYIDAEGELVLESIGFRIKLRAAYRTSGIKA
jgi:Uma2 family endonuclease